MSSTPRSAPTTTADAAGSPSKTETAWHAIDVGEVREVLGVSPDGLSSEQASARLGEHGPNLIPEAAPPSALRTLVEQFVSPLILVLIGAAAVTLAIGELLDTLLIAVALLLNAVIGFTQERRAAGAVSALMELVVPRCHVIRDGGEQEIDSSELVPGDLVLLEPGSKVPADLRITSENSLMIDESLLTGESLPTHKQTPPVDVDAVTGDRVSMAFTGTIVASGRGRGHVVATGLDTELGEIADEIGSVDPLATPLQERMHRFALVIVFSVLIAASVTFASGVALGNSATTMFHTAVAMAVSAVPEALPVATTVTLAIGVSRMARRNAVLRRLPALETLGSTNVIGSDKTGTLTENSMTVEAIWAAGTVHEVPADLPGPDGPALDEALGLTLLAGLMTNEARYEETDAEVRTTGDPTEVAMLVAASAAGLDHDDLRNRHAVVHEIPFEPDLRYSASTREMSTGLTTFVKGAPEQVIEMCTHVLTATGEARIDPDAVLEASRQLAARGLRVLAMAYRQLDPEESPTGDDGQPEGLVLAGLQAMMDPPREGVREAIEACREAGLRVIMITGDHAATARAIGVRLGIVTDADARVLTGADLVELDDGELRRSVEEVAVFARVSPSDKLRIVRALQAQGHIVAVTGDGVNDGPALNAAAIGIAMGRDGTDVAREASDMVLSDDNFVSIVGAVEEGRIAFANIRKVSFFLLSTAAAETFAIMMTVWLGWPLLLIPAQILWLNLVTNGVQDMALAFEPGSPNALKRPPRPAREGILSPMMWERTVVAGIVMAAGALYMFRWELDRSDSLISAQTVALTTLVAYNVFQAGNARSENRSLFALSPWSNPFLFWATLGAVSLHVAALHLPFTQFILGVEPIDLQAAVRGVVVASSILFAIEIHKAIRRRWPLESGSAIG